jgi:hypothetical protein
MKDAKEELVTRLSYEVAKDVAPDELDLFDDIKEEFLKNPDAFVLKEPRKKEEKMLGFGGSGVEQFVITAVLPIVWSVLSYIAKAGIESFKDAAAKKVDGVVKKTVLGDAPLSKEKIKEIREYAIATALTQGMDEKKAVVIADSLIGKLVQM